MNVGESFGHFIDVRTWEKTDLLADTDVFVGVEIELEHFHPVNFDPYKKQILNSSLWRTVNDHSLRDNGLEFVMGYHGDPLKGKDIITALSVFQTHIDKYISKNEPPECSDRTSIHVHIDVRDLEIEDVKRYVLLYSIFENVFYKWSDYARYFNNYCVPISRSKDLSGRLSKLMSVNSGINFNSAIVSGHKYDGLNYKSIQIKGSLEFRLLRGTYDTKFILDWINLLLCLRIAAKDKSLDITSIPKDMSNRGLDKLVDEVFGPYGEVLKDSVNPVDILEGLRVAQGLIIYEDIVKEAKKFGITPLEKEDLLNNFKKTLSKDYILPVDEDK